ncbi:MAG: carbon-nitrogen hydrolase family protein [Rhodobiaceae bacterium]|nr:carbon-nitrogen hydrolase family protein [Rhodobiaceae bacterium]
MTRDLTIAAAQYPVDRLPDFTAFEMKIRAWVGEAAGQGADVLVFPEYAGLELSGLFDDDTAFDLTGSVTAIQPLLPLADDLHAELAREHRVVIVSGSRPQMTEDGIVNRAAVFSPSGRASHQDKRMLIRFEDEEWGIASGGPLRVFDTGSVRFGISICYDSEFPLIARAQAEAGAEVILIPSVTEALSGFHRVRIGAQARALENQCVTVQAPLVGAAPWSNAIDISRGRAGIFGPPDIGFPETGVIAEGEMDIPQWVIATVDLDAVGRARSDGAVLNHRLWPKQADGALPLPPVEVVDLT